MVGLQIVGQLLLPLIAVAVGCEGRLRRTDVEDVKVRMPMGDAKG